MNRLFYTVSFTLATIVAFVPRARSQHGDETSQQKSDRLAYERASGVDWHEVFADPCTGSWGEKWTLDGEIATVTNTPEGMVLRAGPEFRNNAHHMVLWTKDTFEGDVRIEYDYSRLDNETKCVNILYIQASGSGKAPYVADISQWAELRRVPAMKMYFNHMNTYHVSYAAFPNNEDTEDYVRARRYMPAKQGLKGTDLLPDYSRSGLFQTGVPHRISVIKRGNDVVMRVSNETKTSHYHWHNDQFPPIESGRIGLRQMFTRSSRYRDFRISLPSTAQRP